MLPYGGSVSDGLRRFVLTTRDHQLPHTQSENCRFNCDCHKYMVKCSLPRYQAHKLYVKQYFSEHSSLYVAHITCDRHRISPVLPAFEPVAKYISYSSLYSSSRPPTSDRILPATTKCGLARWRKIIEAYLTPRMQDGCCGSHSANACLSVENIPSSRSISLVVVSI